MADLTKAPKLGLRAWGVLTRDREHTDRCCSCTWADEATQSPDAGSPGTCSPPPSFLLTTSRHVPPVPQRTTAACSDWLLPTCIRSAARRPKRDAITRKGGSMAEISVPSDRPAASLARARSLIFRLMGKIGPRTKGRKSAQRIETKQNKTGPLERKKKKEEKNTD
ncbi:hypothetical protein BaRGS_00006505 [Batillaria attramentaria]|uniref:Uncharacterized protein n=1 Tax=Batillaria attramentaria TaxID=370345 RepID=A0ABD0LSL3_9CAEN